MSTDNVVEPDADAYEEDEDARDLETHAVTGSYVEPAKGQDPQVTK